MRNVRAILIAFSRRSGKRAGCTAPERPLDAPANLTAAPDVEVKTGRLAASAKTSSWASSLQNHWRFGEKAALERLAEFAGAAAPNMARHEMI